MNKGAKSLKNKASKLEEIVEERIESASNILKENAFIVKIFLGETSVGSFVAKTDIDFYAFDSNHKIINV